MNLTLIQLLAKHFSKASMLSKLCLIIVGFTVYGMLVLYKRIELNQEAIIHCHEQRVNDIHLVLQKINRLDSKLTLGDILPEPALTIAEQVAKKKQESQKEN